jgi:hypothetical protein
MALMASTKQQVLDGRRRTEPLLVSKRYGSEWWWLPVDYQESRPESVGAGYIADSDSEAGTDASPQEPATLPSSANPCDSNVSQMELKTADTILPRTLDSRDVMAEPFEPQALWDDAQSRQQDGMAVSTGERPIDVGVTSGTDPDIAEWMANLPPYATDLHCH